MGGEICKGLQSQPWIFSILDEDNIKAIADDIDGISHSADRLMRLIFVRKFTEKRNG
ncbi:hypothetical protein [Paenibacillus sp. FSL L8-0463]|uniref:hypothetical protein n=1 Tax=Paenibacillus sp. FSL L8-0463 TaxID=2954687 RepID=UPI00311A2CB0